MWVLIDNFPFLVMSIYKTISVKNFRIHLNFAEVLSWRRSAKKVFLKILQN